MLTAVPLIMETVCQLLLEDGRTVGLRTLDHSRLFTTLTGRELQLPICGIEVPVSGEYCGM